MFNKRQVPALYLNLDILADNVNNKVCHMLLKKMKSLDIRIVGLLANRLTDTSYLNTNLVNFLDTIYDSTLNCYSVNKKVYVNDYTERDGLKHRLQDEYEKFKEILQLSHLQSLPVEFDGYIQVINTNSFTSQEQLDLFLNLCKEYGYNTQVENSIIKTYLLEYDGGSSICYDQAEHNVLFSLCIGKEVRDLNMIKVCDRGVINENTFSYITSNNVMIIASILMNKLSVLCEADYAVQALKCSLDLFTKS